MTNWPYRWKIIDQHPYSTWQIDNEDGAYHLSTPQTSPRIIPCCQRWWSFSNGSYWRPSSWTRDDVRYDVYLTRSQPSIHPTKTMTMTATEIMSKIRLQMFCISSFLMENLREIPSPFTKRWKRSSACRCHDSRWNSWSGASKTNQDCCA